MLGYFLGYIAGILVCGLYLWLNYLYFNYRLNKMYKKAFDDAKTDEQLLDIVYNTFELKEKKSE